MADATGDPQHLTRAVTELGRRRPVVVARAIYNTQGIKVIDAGVTVDERLYERLMQHRLAAPIEDAVRAEPCVHGALLRERAVALAERQPLFARMLAPVIRRDRLLAAIESVPLPPPIALQLTVLLELHPAQFEHALACALTAAWLGDEALVTRQELAQLAAAGLLHDLGMLHVDPVLLQPAVPLRREQRQQLYAHPLVSAMLIERHHDYPRGVVRAVLEHHEALDGSGYPRHLAGDAIGPWGRIVALAELVSARHALPAARFEARLSLQLRMSRGRFDEALVQRLHRLLGGRGADGAAPPRAASIERLRTLQRALGEWPAALADSAAFTAERRRTVAEVSDRCAAVLRSIADAGAAPAQLAMLETVGAGGDDGALELALLADEAAWQLRTLGRLARRRWRAASGEDLPPALQQWLERTDAAVIAPDAPAVVPGPGAPAAAG